MLCLSLPLLDPSWSWSFSSRPRHTLDDGDDDGRFVPLKQLKSLAYDHDEMLKTALERLQGKLSYTTIARFLVNKNFTLSELQQVYESILQTTFDKRNFRKKILSLGIVVETGERQSGVKNRPAQLYTFPNKKIIEIPLIS